VELALSYDDSHTERLRPEQQPIRGSRLRWTGMCRTVGAWVWSQATQQSLPRADGPD